MSIYERWSYDWFSSSPPPLNPSSRYPPLPHSLTESQVDREVHCIHCYCLFSMQNSLGSSSNGWYHFLHRLSHGCPTIDYVLNFKSFRNQLFLIMPWAISTQDTPTGAGRLLVQRFLYWSCMVSRISVPLGWLRPWHWITVTSVSSHPL